MSAGRTHGDGPTFAAPFDMLSACHERLERTLALLAKLSTHLQHHQADGAARDAARDVLRYFDLAAPHHHADEELHVVPRLRAMGRTDLAAQVLDDHAALNRRYEKLRPGLVTLRDAGVVPATGDWPAFIARYRMHLRFEDGVVFALAKMGATAQELAAMGQEMAARRVSVVKPS